MIITRSILSFAPRHRCRFKGIVLPGVQGYKLQDTSYKRTLSVFHVSLLLVNTNTCESRLGVWRERERDNGLPGKALRSGIKRSDPSPGSSADLQSIVSQVTNIGFLRRMDIFRKPSAKDALRTSKREMAVATRGIEREIASLQLEEKKLVAEIKKTAKTGNEAASKILARQLIRLRQQIAKLQGSRAQMRGIATHTQAMYTNTAVAGAMEGAGKAMKAMNKQMEPAKQSKVMQEFQRQSAQMEMTTEMMSDTIDDALDNDNCEEETDELTNQVLDEIGVDIAAQLSSTPKVRLASKSRAQNTGGQNVEELEQRLAALRNV